MIYLPSDKLKEGMVLARSIPSNNVSIPFAVEGFKLNQNTIQKIIDLGVQGAYIETAHTEGIEPEDFVEPELKVQMLQSIKKIFDRNLKQGNTGLGSSEYMEMSSVAKDVVMNVLSQDKVMCQMIDIRDYDNYTYYHSLYVGVFSVLLGRYLGFSQNELNKLALSGLLHDIGKTDIPLWITNKPGKLSAEEYNIMKQHPVLSASKLKKNLRIPYSVVEGVLCHHERYDGSGYPSGLAGEHIPIYGRILAVADVYDALHSTRSYRKAWSPKKIFNYLMANANIGFDSDLLTAFLHCIAAYPVGTLVELSDGSTAVVKDNTPGFALRPVVRLLTPAAKAGSEIDLSCECMNITIVDSEEKAE